MHWQDILGVKLYRKVNQLTEFALYTYKRGERAPLKKHECNKDGQNGSQGNDPGQIFKLGQPVNKKKRLLCVLVCLAYLSHPCQPYKC